MVYVFPCVDVIRTACPLGSRLIIRSPFSSLLTVTARSTLRWNSMLRSQQTPVAQRRCVASSFGISTRCTASFDASCWSQTVWPSAISASRMPIANGYPALMPLTESTRRNPGTHRLRRRSLFGCGCDGEELNESQIVPPPQAMLDSEHSAPKTPQGCAYSTGCGVAFVSRRSTR
ncbi:hypothetical protein C8Q76DRAFT_183354 [Earliella scabrosa]|nr:hypothetical protein C8Q76DRAFT_183354 [Earliella scabrosa]